VPDRLCNDQAFQQTLTVQQDNGDIRVDCAAGTTVIFDSFSSEQEVQCRNMYLNSVSKINDPVRHFPVNFNVEVKGTVAAVLGPSTVSSYRVVDRRAQEPVVPPDNRPEHVKMSMKRKETELPMSEFDMEIERRKRQCALLLSDLACDMSRDSLKGGSQGSTSFASVISSSSQKSSSFASIVADNGGHRTPLGTTPTRSFKSPLVALQASMYGLVSSPESDEFLFCERVRREMHPCLRAGASDDEIIAIQALRNMLPSSLGES
jgi:hypothetical protein